MNFWQIVRIPESHPLIWAYGLLVALTIGGFVMVGTLASEAKSQACEAFKDSQQLLKDVLVLSIPVDPPNTEELSTEEAQEALVAHERRIVFRDRLVSTIEERDCQ